ncbi:hypothetical protein ENSA5_16240 [Enhygromyxa salina]|uniref:Uncharacterized protein n=2 Tax=Enhygromyxa salina TaxID=215803 RepID=A0A2S9YE66_9BACT|nr:hypothetical protein ENSA5_16240 [Enhygromyxa salina]
MSVFGATYTTSVAQMLDDLEFQLLANRFFRVAIDRNPEQMTQEDLYVDLSRSDGEDAPLISILEEWTGREPPLRGHTVLSKSLSRVFYDFDLRQRGFLGYLARSYRTHLDGTRWEDYSDAMTRLVERMGLPELIHIRPDVRCYSSSELSLKFEAMGVDLRTPDGYLQIWIGADNRDAFLNYAAQIRSHMPPLPILDEWRVPRPPNSPI